MSSQPALRKKRRPYRREQILTEAVQLFAERGYHATGMNDIGAAVGITGPGIYRHFASKESILEAAIELLADEMLERVTEILQTSSDPLTRLERLVRNGIDAFLDNPSLILTAVHERRSLTDIGRRTLDHSNRLRVDEWAEPLAELRSGLSEREVRFLAATTQQMLLAAEPFTALPREELTQYLFSVAMSVLLP